MEICAHTPDPPVSEAWGWWGKSLLIQALEHPHTLSSRQAGPSHFPSISLSISPPDLVTGCSCPLPLIDPSAQAHPCQVSATPQCSKASPKLLHSAQGRHRCGWRARPRLLGWPYHGAQEATVQGNKARPGSVAPGLWGLACLASCVIARQCLERLGHSVFL